LRSRPPRALAGDRRGPRSDAVGPGRIGVQRPRDERGERPAVPGREQRPPGVPARPRPGGPGPAPTAAPAAQEGRAAAGAEAARVQGAAAKEGAAEEGTREERTAQERAGKEGAGKEGVTRRSAMAARPDPRIGPGRVIEQ